MKRTTLENKHNIIIVKSDRTDSKYMYYAVGDMRTIRYADTLKDIDNCMAIADQEYEMLMNIA